MSDRHMPTLIEPIKARFWDGDQWPERRVSIANADGHAMFISARYADIEVAKVEADEISKRVNHHAELVELVDSAATALEMAGYMETASMLRGKLAGLDTKKA